MTTPYEFSGFLEDDTGRHHFRLSISEPIKGETGEDYYCVVHAPLLFKTDKRIYGIDKEQANLLAHEFTKQMLSERKLLDEAGQGIELQDVCMNVDEVKKLAEKHDYDQALAECNGLLKSLPADKVNTLRTRAYVYSLMGDYRNALQDREAVLQSNEAKLGDYYLAGDSALSFGNFKKAATYLNETLLLGHRQNETWFDSGASFLLAYVELELGRYESALKNLDRAILLDADCAMPLPGIGMCDHNCLRKEIVRRKEEGR